MTEDEEAAFDDPGEIWTVDSNKGEWLWQKVQRIKTHDPMDRVGGPFHVTGFIDDGGDKFFIFAVADCAFPLHDLVKSNSLESAYEAYIDWAAKKRHIEIAKGDLKDYDEENLHYTSDGIPVDDESVTGFPVRLVKAVPRITGKNWRPRRKES